MARALLVLFREGGGGTPRRAGEGTRAGPTARFCMLAATESVEGELGPWERRVMISVASDEEM